MQIIDEIITEPVGGAHRNKDQMISTTKEILIKYLEEFNKFSRDEIFEQRKEKFLNIGKDESFKIFSNHSLRIGKNNIFISMKKALYKFKKEIVLIIFLALMIIWALYLFAFFLDFQLLVVDTI